MRERGRKRERQRETERSERDSAVHIRALIVKLEL